MLYVKVWVRNITHYCFHSDYKIKKSPMGYDAEQGSRRKGLKKL